MKMENIDIKIDNQSWFDRIVLKWPKESIISVNIFVTALILVPFYKLMPILLSYAPGVRENPHIHTMLYGDSYNVHYWNMLLIL